MSKIVTFLVNHSGLKEADVRSILARAPRSYKFYRIPKRTEGYREIAQPAREVKHLQRLFVRGLQRLPVHEAATAYRKGTSIRLNAQRHSNNGPIMKFDFSNFFPSIRDEDWQAYCAENQLFEGEDVELSSKLLFHRRGESSILNLAIGAPSSPWLSNVLMYNFDDAMTKAVEEDKVTYTRYADDLTFSAPRTGYLNGVEKALRKIVRDHKHPRLKINEDKSVVATTKYRRVVTGLVLSLEGDVTVGRDRKRLIRAMLDHASKGKLDGEQILKLRGLLAFALDIEPDYFAAAVNRYAGNLPAPLLELLPD